MRFAAKPQSQCYSANNGLATAELSSGVGCFLQVGEPRMWLPDRPVPGLLLSRAVGDEVASTVGCIACPEVVHRRLRPNCDAFLVLASDGVWDVLTTSQACSSQLYPSLQDCYCPPGCNSTNTLGC